MSESKPTPGPWKVFRDNADKWYKRRIYAGDNNLVANILNGHEPNARLIAAAPELLEALEEIVARNEIQHWFNLDQARAAIAKAKGGE